MVGRLPIELVVEVQAALGAVAVIDHAIEVRARVDGARRSRRVVVGIGAIEDREAARARDVDLAPLTRRSGN